MELETQSFDFTEIFDSLSPKRSRSPYSRGKRSPARTLDLADVERVRFFESILRNNRAEFISLAKRIFTGDDAESERTEALKLLNICCRYDSVDCASSLINGDVRGGAVPYINDVEAATGLSPLHAAAEAHAPRCAAMLLKRRARTDIRSRDGRALLPLELSLRSIHVIWNPNGNSVGDLVLLIGEKDLTVVKLLAEKTKEFGAVAYASAVAGLIVHLAALLIVAANKIEDATVEWHDTECESQQRRTIYESVIQEALGERCSMQSGCSLKRLLLLREIELLQLFGAAVFSERVDKRLISPLITAALAGDEAILELLLKTNIDVNEADAEGNTALLCCLKGSSVPHTQQTRVMCLLIERGANVGLRNKLGFSALHLAAANGNLAAVEILLFESPDSINFKTEMKETPLFFAVKNNHLACVELLLRWGANTEIHNLRKQRPIDLAESQDMRFMLNPTNISSFTQPSPETELTPLHTEVPRKSDEETAFERSPSMTKLVICKYFESPTGCTRGSKCFYAHGVEELQQHTPLKRQVFTGGLPPSLDPGENLTPQSNFRSQSRQHGFVTFKNESSSEAIPAHHLNISGERVETKTSADKSLLLDEIEKHQSARYGDEKNKNRCQTQTHTINEMTPTANPTSNNKENPSWAEILLHYQPTKSCTSTSKEQIFSDKPGPVWLKKFTTWLPRFLQHASENGREAGYPLSSLKGDFRAIFSMELDHASLGYQKLSDFIKSFPKLCQMKVVPIGKSGPATHWVLLPSCSQLKGRPLQPLMISCNTNGSIFHEPVRIHEPKIASSSYDVRCSDNFKQQARASKISELELPDQAQSLSHSSSRQLRHPVLETLARIRNNTSMFFLREFDFYQSYEACIRQGMCFWCNKTQQLWENFPCGHKLWCTDCKQEAFGAAGKSDHRCVICDTMVESLVLSHPPIGFDHLRLTDLPNNNEFACSLLQI